MTERNSRPARGFLSLGSVCLTGFVLLVVGVRDSHFEIVIIALIILGAGVFMALRVVRIESDHRKISKFEGDQLNDESP